MSLLAAALISFLILTFSGTSMVAYLVDLLDPGGGLGPLGLPTLSGSVVVEALIACALLTIISVTIILAERHYDFPGWLPFALAFPVAWCLTLPSALELGGSWRAWLAFGTLTACIFCIHWRAVTWARTIWD